MKDVVSRQCDVDDCGRQPTFGLESRKPTHCKDHATPEMKDVINKQCVFENCVTRATRGMEWMKPTHCKKHESLDMKDVVNKRCSVDNCDVQPTFGMEWKKPTHCKEHAIPGMNDALNKRCEHCQLTIMNEKYKPNCAQCHFYLNPEDPRIRNYKTKEHAFMLPLQETHPDLVRDKTIQGGCSKRRPDGLIDCYTHSVIIEIDEDQHVGYDSSCDRRRIMELFGDLGARPVVFVRLNPDSYVVDGKRVDAVFSLSKSGEFTQNKTEFERRFQALLEAVAGAITVPPTREVSIIKLCYSD